MQSRRRAWVRPVAAILVLALLVSSAPAVAARPNLPPVEPITYTLDGSLLPAGNGITPLSLKELQEVDGEIAPGLVAAARVVVACARSAACRTVVSRVARATINAVRHGFEIVGAKYTYEEFRRRHGW